MKKIKFTILILILINVYACNTIQEAFVPQKRNNSEEFLVKKKSPLVMPPNFNDLPVPKINQNLSSQNEKDIQSLVGKNYNLNKNESTNKIRSNSLEELVLKKISDK